MFVCGMYVSKKGPTKVNTCNCNSVQSSYDHNETHKLDEHHSFTVLTNHHSLTGILLNFFFKSS